MEPQNLWANKLRAKYKQDLNLLTENSSKKSSMVWNEMRNSLPILREGLKFLVGDGRRISTLNDPLVFNIPINRLPTFVNQELVVSLNFVSELRVDGNSWNENPLLECFPGRVSL